MQSLSFLPMDDGAWMGVGAGDRVVVELVQEALEDQALVPISAVDSRDRVWFVEDGIATPVEIDLTLRNDAYVAVPAGMGGQACCAVAGNRLALSGLCRQGGQGAVKTIRFLETEPPSIFFAAPAPLRADGAGNGHRHWRDSGRDHAGRCRPGSGKKRDGASWHRPGMVDRFGGTDIAPWRRSAAVLGAGTPPQPSRYTRRLKHARAAVRKAAYWLGVPVSIWI